MKLVVLIQPAHSRASYTSMETSKLKSTQIAVVFVFPGDGDPEAHIFEAVLMELDTIAAKLTAALNLPTSEQERVKKVVRERAITNLDRHIIFRQIGDDLDLTAELVVANAFVGLWAQLREAEIRDLLDPIRDQLPMKPEA